MERPELSQIEAFIHVAECGSFSGAARHLGVPKSSVSRRVAALERVLGLPLVRRTTRHTSLTDEGRAYWREVSSAMEQLHQAHDSVRNLQNDPIGTIRLTMPIETDLAAMGELVAEFLSIHPKVTLEIEATNRFVNLLDEGFDLGIRGGVPQDSSLRIRKLSRTEPIIVASPRYLEAFGSPKVLKELSTHRGVATTSRGPLRWTLTQNGHKETVTLPAVLAVNDLRLARDAVVAGLGITLLPDFVCAPYLASGALVRLFPDCVFPGSFLSIVYPPSPPPRVRTLIDFLAEKLGVADAER